ncbi:hypothetical protein, partial [Roseiconus lacunae]|uniref:hypothetical protein n=1 Tax=Roseiconus lacunae TaxID=2605694 RepID=UPI00193EED2E
SPVAECAERFGDAPSSAKHTQLRKLDQKPPRLPLRLFALFRPHSNTKKNAEPPLYGSLGTLLLPLLCGFV